MTKKLFIRTFGCQMNEYDSDKMADVLNAAEGVVKTDNPEEADIILFNTCSVREKAQEKVFHDLGRSVVHPLWDDIADGAYFYFVHSYYARPADPAHAVGETDFGGRFASAIARDNIFATQFHPEKSADQGLALYRNFLSWKP